MLFAGTPRVSMAGCSAALSHCLTQGFVLSLSGCSRWKEVQRGSIGWEAGLGLGTNSELSEPPAGLSHARHPPNFSTSILPPSLHLPPPFSFFRSLFFLVLSLTKMDLKPTGPDPRTGLLPLAYQELPQRSPDAVIES